MNGFWRKAIHIRAEWICLSGKRSEPDRMGPYELKTTETGLIRTVSRENGPKPD